MSPRPFDPDTDVGWCAPPSAVPDAAVTAAYEAFRQFLGDGRTAGRQTREGIAKALEAAAPAIAAAERERILAGDDNDPDPAGSVYRLGHRDGKAAEREACAQLAEQVRAVYVVYEMPDYTGGRVPRSHSVADLIRARTTP